MYREHGGLVYRRCLQMLRDPDEARAGVQEVFLRVMSRLDKEEKVGNGKSYLYAAATNYCLNVMRGRKQLCEAIDCDGHADWEGMDPARQLASHNALEECLGGLSERERLMVFLYWGDGMTQEEVARAVGLSRKTVVERLGRLRQRLRLNVRNEEGAE